MKSKKLVVLLSRQRSGTNALRAVLESHPDIHCFGEVLSYDQRDLDADYSFVSFARSRHADAFGDPGKHLAIFDHFVKYLHSLHDKSISLIDLKYSSCHHISQHWKYLTETPIFNWIMDNGVPVIRLRRNNYLRVSLSEEVAQVRNRWHDRKGEKPVDTDVALPNADRDMKFLHRQLRTWQLEDQIVSETFADYPQVCEVQYTEMFPRMDVPICDSVLERVSTFLDVSPQYNTETWCAKSNRRPFWNSVTNWHQVRTFLTGTEFEYCLLDEPMYRDGQSPGPDILSPKIPFSTASELKERLRKSA